MGQQKLTLAQRYLGDEAEISEQLGCSLEIPINHQWVEMQD